MNNYELTKTTMGKIQAKTELARYRIMSLFKHFVSVDEDGVSSLCYVTFDTMAEIVDYLRSNEYLIKVEDFDLLLKENRKLNNECIRLTIENANLKEKCKNLPRIATLNKRIHELKEQIKKYERE